MKHAKFKKAITALLIMAVLITQISIAASAEVTPVQPSGAGTSDDPYKLATANDLLWFKEQVNGGGYDICAELTADIDMSSVCSPENGSWTPINGNYSGTLNGNGHEIKNLYINNPEADYQGLFGNPSYCTVQNLGLVDCDITGRNSVGGFVGSSERARVIGCYVSGTVSGNDKVGGIYGALGADSASNNISAATVSGNTNVGIICGRLGIGMFSNSVGIKTGSLPLFGAISGGATENVKEFSDLSTGEACYFMNGNSGIKPTWYQSIGDNGDAYPVLNSAHGVVYKVGESYSSCTSHTAADGFCTTCGMLMPNKYTTDTDGNIVIDTAKRLLWFSYYVNNINKNANAVLADDIDLFSVCSAEKGSWMPIGNNSARFGGAFDGKGYTVSGLYINTEDNYQGLFGYIETTGKVMNCFVSGSVTATGEYLYVGGLCGDNTGTVSGSGSSCTVTVTGNNNRVGGVCGYNMNGSTITDCYNYGAVTVTGDSNKIGGITGYNSSWYSSLIGTVKNCCNTGAVSASGTDNKLGGVIGHENSADYSVVTNNYYLEGSADGGINGADTAGKATAATAAELQSGKVTYLLNGGVTDGTQKWYQTCGTGYPAFSGQTVYAYTNCKSEAYYTNNPALAGTTGQHAYVNGICRDCGKYKPAVLNNNGTPDVSTDDYYVIGNVGNLKWFSALVNGDTALTGGAAQNTSANALLTVDLSLDDTFARIGTNTSRYSGTFDGGGHTVTVNYNVITEKVGGLFDYVNGAAVSNLIIAGSISTSNHFVGGLIGHEPANTDTVTLNNILSCVNITSSFSGDNTHGGIIAVSDSPIIMTNCGYTGTITAANGTNCGGLNGWTNKAAAFTNCYMAGAMLLSSTGGSATLCRGNAGNISQTNCYYYNSCGTEQGIKKEAGQFSSGEVTYLLNGGKTDGTQVWYQNIDNGVTPYDAYPRFTGGTVYCSESEYSNYSCIKSSSPSTEVDEENKLVYTDTAALRSLDSLLTPLAGYTFSVTPSLRGTNYFYCGTGSVITVSSSAGTYAAYTLIVKGDINGDSICDALDCMAAELVLGNHIKPTASEKAYYDTDRNGEVDISDYQQIVNCSVGID